LESKNTNVLQLMKEWKNEIENEHHSGEEGEAPSGEHSAINGIMGPPEGEEETPAPETNNNDANTETDDKRKGSGGTKKPGSGGKVGVVNVSILMFLYAEMHRKMYKSFHVMFRLTRFYSLLNLSFFTFS